MNEEVYESLRQLVRSAPDGAYRALAKEVASGGQKAQVADRRAPLGMPLETPLHEICKLRE